MVNVALFACGLSSFVAWHLSRKLTWQGQKCRKART